MTNNEASNNDLAYAEILWKSANVLRGQIDAAEYTSERVFWVPREARWQNLQD